MKQCFKCKESKELSEYSGVRNTCKPCCATYSKEYREKHKERYRAHLRVWNAKNKDYLKNWKLKKRYGITLEQFRKLGNCALCGEDKDLTLDHCHSSNKVRGVLCRNCNAGLGHFKDNILIMSKAIRYLKKHAN
jgi:5-methylcytosine-specific restriction endonuclease McrA